MRAMTLVWGLWVLVGTVSQGYATPLEIGGHAGLNFSAIVDTPPTDTPDAPQMAMSFGLNSRYRLSEIFSFETGLEWAYRKQGRRVSITQAAPYQLSASFRELRVPLLARYGGVVGFSFAGGMYFSRIFSDVSWSVNPAPSAADLSSTPNLVEDGKTLSLSELGWAQSDYGLELRLGYQFPIGRDLYLFLDVDYRVGMKNLAENDTSGRTKKSGAYGLVTGVTVPL